LEGVGRKLLWCLCLGDVCSQQGYVACEASSDWLFVGESWQNKRELPSFQCFQCKYGISLLSWLPALIVSQGGPNLAGMTVSPWTQR